MGEMQRENLIMKTFEAESAEEIDKAVNDFKKDNEVFYTVPLINYKLNGEKDFTYIVWYLPKKTILKDLPKKEEVKECPKCKESIPVNYNLHLKCGWRKNEKWIEEK